MPNFHEPIWKFISPTQIINFAECTRTMTCVENLKYIYIYIYLDGLVQERRNSIANALELRLSCTNPSLCSLSVASCLLTLWVITKLGLCVDGWEAKHA